MMVVPSGPALDQLVLLGVAALALAVVLLVLRRSPRTAFVAWVVSMCTVPFWLGTPIGPTLPPGTVMAVVVLAALLPVSLGRVTLADGVLVLVVVAAVGIYAIGATTLASVFTLLTEWAVGFALGRIVPARVGLDWVYRCLAVAFTVVAGLALVEYLLTWNPFVTVGSSSWAELQERGGALRAEGAFGHSIALGACLALVIPLVLASTFGIRLRLGMVAVMLAATAVTFSRIAMVCAVLGIVLSIVFAREGMSGRVRAGVTAALAVVAAVLVPLVDETFAAAGDEASGSAAYRGNLLSLLEDIELVGLTEVFQRTATGEVRFGTFNSIDSALVLFGLYFGWVLLALVLALLVAAGVLVVTRRAGAPTIAVLAQVPALASVALITQYGMFVFFVAGLAVYAQASTPGIPSGRSASGASTSSGRHGRGVVDPSTAGPPARHQPQPSARHRAVVRPTG